MNFFILVSPVKEYKEYLAGHRHLRFTEILKTNRVRTNMEHFNLFSAPGEKGSNEWAAFSGIREDHPGMYRVEQPKPRRTVTTIERPARPQSLFLKQRPQH